MYSERSWISSDVVSVNIIFFYFFYETLFPVLNNWKYTEQIKVFQEEKIPSLIKQNIFSDPLRDKNVS